MGTSKGKVCEEIVTEMLELFQGQINLNKSQFDNGDVCEIIHNVAINLYAKLIFFLNTVTDMPIEELHEASNLERVLQKYKEL